MDDKLFRIRHSAAHVLAEAVLEVFPEAKLGVGPPIADGFYYDFDLPRPLTEDDLPDLEERMKRIIKENQALEYREVSEAEAREIFADQPYKLELIDLIASGGLDENLEKQDGPVTISTYRNGPFEDLCRGPHVEATGKIRPGAVKLTRVSAAYWRGSEKNPMLQRIYGTAWATPKELREYLHRLEEAKKRDHRLLGKQLDLFSTSEAVGPGLILWHPKGAMTRFLFDRFSQEAHLMNGYQWVFTPHIGKAGLWETSGHLQFFKDAMYAPIELDQDEYYLKPMNCPFHIQIFKSRPRSYRDLPVKYAEYGTVYRYEKSGTLHGLTRVRGFTQDDAHIFCTPDQVADEISHAFQFSLYVLRTMGLSDFVAYLSTKPENKAIGTDQQWKMAEDALEATLKEAGVTYKVDEGGGAFYGPKIDLKVLDALGREWQLSTVQFDFNLPERFDLEFTGSDGEPHRPYMVHRALFGSAERFFAMLIEHHKGAMPLWLAPVQVVVVPITDDQNAYGREVVAALQQKGFRIELNDRKEKMHAKIRDAQLAKIPYVLVIGKREAENGTVSVRHRSEGDQGSMTLESFLEKTASERAVGTPRTLDEVNTKG